MKTISVNIYPFAELNVEAKKKVLKTFESINVEYNEWYQDEIELMKNQLFDHGFIDAEIFFSGFDSQGDGACFTCKRVDLSKMLLQKYKDLPLKLYIKHVGRYNHEHSAETTPDHNSWLEDIELECCQAVEKYRVELCKKIYSSLRRTYYELLTDKAIIETIEANEYTFMADGTLFKEQEG